MRYLGTKFIGTDSSVFVLDTKSKSFAISTERITRNKHDPFDISPIFSEIKGLNKIRYEVVSVPFNNFENNDFLCQQNLSHSLFSSIHCFFGVKIILR